MVDQHPVAGPEASRQRPQADVADAVLCGVLDGRSEQTVLWGEVAKAVASLDMVTVPTGSDVVYHLVHATRIRLHRSAPIADVVFAFLDVAANHAPFNDHMLRDWAFTDPRRGSAPDRGHGGGRRAAEPVAIEVVEATRRD